MIRKIIIILVISTIFIVLLSFLKPTPTGLFLEENKENLINNPSFEERRPENPSLPAEWYFDTKVGLEDKDEIVWDINEISLSSNSYSGNLSILFNLNKPQTSSIKSRTFPINPHTDYMLTFYVKPHMMYLGGDPYFASMGFFANIVFYNDTHWLDDEFLYFNNTELWVPYNYEFTTSWKNVDNWKKITMIVTSPSTSTKSNILFGLDGNYSGKVLIDDVHVTTI